MKKDSLIIRGAKEHNLKNFDIEIPRNKFVVFTGLSGSGKSSLAFDTIYAEGQRRYVESLSSYARQFLGQMEKPSVTSIEGLSPAISIDQKTTNRNPRSTVGTVTEIYDYFRLLYARTGTPHCSSCGREITPTSIDEIVEKIMHMPEGSKILLLSPIVNGEKGSHAKLIEGIVKQGFLRCRINGQMYEMSDSDAVSKIKLNKNKKHNIDVVVDRLVIKSGIESRLTDSAETALSMAEGKVLVFNVDNGEETLYNTLFSCPEHGSGIAEMEPRMFSFNAPFGACPECSGLGEMKYVDEKLIIPDTSLSIAEGALKTLNSNNDDSYNYIIIKALLEEEGQSDKTPFNELPPELQHQILHGSGKRKIRFYYESRFSSRTNFNKAFEGIVPNLTRRYKETSSDYMRQYIEGYMSIVPCPSCHGARLTPDVLAVTVGGLNIHSLSSLSVAELIDFFENLEFSDYRAKIAEIIVKEILDRLNFLKKVGLDYLTLSRSAASLSGGESQRIRLATQIGSGLVGVMYILDEPSIGLHQKDNAMLIDALRSLTNMGNTLIVVEHDEETMLQADHIVDLGPGAGESGGYIVAQGSSREIMRVKESITGQYLSGSLSIPIPQARRKPRTEGSIIIKKATQNNLKNIDVKIPLGVLTVVTGVSGSGKSTLINEILYKESMIKLHKSSLRAGKSGGVIGLEHIDKIIDIDQSPIGKTPRSNPATYTGVFDHIRDLFAQTKDAKKLGYKKGRFSFNVSGGRCENCRGDGIKKIEMHFLPDIYVQCDICKGKRYNKETLSVTYKGKNISQVLEMSVTEALEFFDSHTPIKRRLQTIKDVGLGYVRLGQPSPQLSGGEAQRVKLATELSKVGTGNTLYILDEPTTGLHTSDVHTLINVLQRLVDAGNSVIVIEHNLDMIKSADHIIDLGPEGGFMGGKVVVTGTPEEIAACKKSHTGRYLKKVLKPKNER